MGFCAGSIALDELLVLGLEASGEEAQSLGPVSYTHLRHDTLILSQNLSKHNWAEAGNRMICWKIGYLTDILRRFDISQVAIEYFFSYN